MSAAVLSHPGMGARVVPPPLRFRMDQRAVRDARLIRQSDEGTAAALWLAWLQTEQPERLAAMTKALEGGPDSEDVEEAMALVRYVSGDDSHKALVGMMVRKMRGGARL